MVKLSSLKSRITLVNLIILVVSSVCIVGMVNYFQKKQALLTAEEESLILLKHNLAIHSYYNKVLKPKLFSLSDSVKDPDYFDPVWMSSTYAVREIDKLYKTQTQNRYYYKEAAINARSPENEADDFERSFITRLKKEPKLEKISGVRQIDGKPYFFTLVRGESMEKVCLRCHSTPEKAPGGLVTAYGPVRSFNRSVEELVSTISIRIPLSEAYAQANRFSLHLSLLLLGILLVVAFVQNKLVTHLVLTPLNRFRSEVEAIAGDPEKVGAAVPDIYSSEMNEIAISFNHMSQQLKFFVDNLEQQVEERTTQLRTSEENYRHLFENMTNGFALHQMIYDRSGKPADYLFLEVNPAFENLTGLRAETVVGRKFSDIMPASEGYWLDVYGKVASTGNTASFEHYSASLGRHYQVWAFSPKKGYFATVFSDITDRVAVQSALQRSEERFRGIVESMADWIWEVDENSAYIYCSPSVSDVLGYAPEEMIGRTPFEFMPPEESDLVKKLFEESWLQKKKISNLINWNITKDGRRICISTSGVPVFGDSGKVVGYRGVDTDITELLQLEERLRQSQKLESVGRLAGGVAHDFNNKLMVILGNAELVRMALPDTDKIEERLHDIVEAAQHSRDITAQLLAFSRQQLIAPKRLDPKQTMEKICRSLSVLIGEQIEMVLEIGNDVWPVHMDPVQFDQIIMNLALNAKDAMPDGGKLSIFIENRQVDEDVSMANKDALPGEYVLVRVSDTGVGMDENTLQHIFEPFFTTKEVGKGTGLGLSTIYGIVVQNKGFINVSSRVGGGTEFSIYLPRCAVKDMDAGTSDSDHYVAGGSILLVEDDADVRRMMKVMLETMGYKVYEAGDANRAVELVSIQGVKIDLVLTDVVMPGTSGKAMMEQIKAFLPSVRVLYMSGYPSDVITSQKIADEELEFIQKPCEYNALAQRLGKLLANG